MNGILLQLTSWDWLFSLNHSSLRIHPDHGMSITVIAKQYLIVWASLIAQRIKRLPAKQKTQVRSLGWEDPWRRKW